MFLLICNCKALRKQLNTVSNKNKVRLVVLDIFFNYLFFKGCKMFKKFNVGVSKIMVKHYFSLFGLLSVDCSQSINYLSILL